MDAVKVPQHLDLSDVLVFGLSAVDLLCLAAGEFVAWWLYLSLPWPVQLRVFAAVPFAALGALFGLGRLGELTSRDLAWAIAGYLRRPRLRLYGIG
jgi:hypothetical protein